MTNPALKTWTNDHIQEVSSWSPYWPRKSALESFLSKFGLSLRSTCWAQYRLRKKTIGSCMACCFFTEKNSIKEYYLIQSKNKSGIKSKSSTIMALKWLIFSISIAFDSQLSEERNSTNPYYPGITTSLLNLMEQSVRSSAYFSSIALLEPLLPPA